MRNVVAKAIEDYLENGTDKEEQPDSSGEEKQDTERKQKKKIVKVEEEMEVPAQIRLYKHQIVQPVEQFGPTISEAER